MSVANLKVAENPKILQNQNIIYFAPEPWDGLWRNRQRLMSIFARQNRVLFVERRQHLKGTLRRIYKGELKLSDLFRPSIRRLSAEEISDKRIRENLVILHYPIWAPVTGLFLVGQFTRWIRQRVVDQALRKCQMSEPIVWFSRPGLVDQINQLPSACLYIYHVVDEYTEYGLAAINPAEIEDPEERFRVERIIEERRAKIRELEQEMMAAVDMVVVVSQNLYQAKKPFNPNTYLVPNAVNYEAYPDALADPWLPDNLQVIKMPRLGYIGLVGDKLDFKMLKGLAQSNPECSLVFIGELRVEQQKEAWQSLQELPNVHYLEPVEISKVPHYVKGFQVGLMPYLENRHAENISPLKLYEYLAAGLPVASVNIPAAREFSSYIHVTDDTQDFTQAVQKALADVSPERCQTRKEVATRHTWEARVEYLSELIRRYDEQKRAYRTE